MLPNLAHGKGLVASNDTRYDGGGGRSVEPRLPGLLRQCADGHLQPLSGVELAFKGGVNKTTGFYFIFFLAVKALACKLPPSSSSRQIKAKSTRALQELAPVSQLAERQAAKRNHGLPSLLQSYQTGASTANISYALVSLNTVNVFIRQNRTFRKSRSVFYLLFSPPLLQRSQLRISVCLLAPGRCSSCCLCFGNMAVRVIPRDWTLTSG